MMYGTVTPNRRPIGWSTFERDFRNRSSDMLSDLNRQFNRLFDDVFDFSNDDNDDGSEKRDRKMKAPALDIAVFDEHYELTAELPGVKQEDIELKVEDGQLILKGEKKATTKSDDRSWSERRFGTFARRIQLAQDVEAEKIDAEFIDGVLKVTMPRTQKVDKGHVITVKAGDDVKQNRLIDDNQTKIAENA